MMNLNIPEALFLYIPNFIEVPDSFDIMLQTIDWDSFQIRQHNAPRKIAHYGEEYSYSGITHPKVAIPPLLQAIIDDVNTFTSAGYNSVLCNLYFDHRSSVSWHQDNEKQLGHDPCIASISFGQARNFAIRSKKNQTRYDILLENNSLLIMGRNSQRLYEHAILKQTEPLGPRINLTLRNIKF